MGFWERVESWYVPMYVCMYVCRRELICALYTALGHPDNTLRTSTYELIAVHQDLFKSVFTSAGSSPQGHRLMNG
jgi:hypothetical protein